MPFALCPAPACGGFVPVNRTGGVYQCPTCKQAFERVQGDRPRLLSPAEWEAHQRLRAAAGAQTNPFDLSVVRLEAGREWAYYVEMYRDVQEEGAWRPHVCPSCLYLFRQQPRDPNAPCAFCASALEPVDLWLMTLMADALAELAPMSAMGAAPIDNRGQAPELGGDRRTL